MDSHVDPYHALGFALKRLQQALRSRMDAALAGLGLTSPQYAVLALLAEDPGISNAELARRAFVAPPTMIRIVTTLADFGLLTRAAPPARGRTRATRLTDEGRQRLAEASAIVQELEDFLRDAATPAHRSVILGWLNTCAERLEVRER